MLPVATWDHCLPEIPQVPLNTVIQPVCAPFPLTCPCLRAENPLSISESFCRHLHLRPLSFPALFSCIHSFITQGCPPGLSLHMGILLPTWNYVLLLQYTLSGTSLHLQVEFSWEPTRQIGLGKGRARHRQDWFQHSQRKASPLISVISKGGQDGFKEQKTLPSTHLLPTSLSLAVSVPTWRITE